MLKYSLDQCTIYIVNPNCADNVEIRTKLGICHKNKIQSMDQGKMTLHLTSSKSISNGCIILFSVFTTIEVPLGDNF